MTDADKDPFSEALGGVAGFYGVTLPATSAAIYWSALAEHQFSDILDAIKAHIKDPERGRWMPKPADIIAKLGPAEIGADAAWEIALRAQVWDEDRTVVVPCAIFMAFPMTAWNSGDKVAARMAFKDAFPSARKVHGMHHIVSEGCDPDGREPAIMEALRNNLISEGTAKRLLPHLAKEIKALAPPESPPLLGGAGL